MLPKTSKNISNCAEGMFKKRVKISKYYKIKLEHLGTDFKRGTATPKPSFCMNFQEKNSTIQTLTRPYQVHTFTSQNFK